MQTALARKLAARLNEKIEGELTIGRVQILPFKTVIVRDAVLTDNDPLATSFFEPKDTVARIGMATVSFSLKGLTGRKPVVLNKVVVRDGLLNLVTEAHHVSNIKRIFHGKEPKPLQDKGDVLHVKQVEARDFHFTLSNALGKKAPKGKPGINWAELDLMADAKAHDFRITGGTVQGVLDDAKATERSGYSFYNTSGRAQVSRGKVEVFDFVLNDDGSHLVLPYYAMRFDNYRSFDHFLDEVELEIQLGRSRLGEGTLRGFAGLALPHLSMDISQARVLGTINDFTVESLSFREQSGISGSLSGEVSRITNLPESYIDAKVDGLTFTTEAAGRLVEAFAPGKGAAIGRYAPGETFLFNGRLKGPADDLALDCALTSQAGSVNGSVKAKDLLDSSVPSRLGGSVAVNNLDLGSLLGTDRVGECSMRGQMDAVLGPGGISLDIDSLIIDKARINGYDYSNIAGAGTFKDDAFNGRIVCSDPNLNFIFQGLVNLSGKTHNALYKFYFNLGYADLYALNLDKRGPSKASLAVNANISRIGKENILGDIDVKDVRLENRDGIHDIGHLSLRSYTSNETQRLSFESAFAQAQFSGSKPVTGLVTALRDGVLYKELPALAAKAPAVPEGEDYRLTLKTADTRDLLSFVLPGLYVAEGTTLNLRMGRDGTLKTELKSQRLALQDKYLKNVTLQARGDGERLLCDLAGDELNAGVKLLGNRIRIEADSNRVGLRYRFDNGTDPETKGLLDLACTLSRNRDNRLNYDIRTLPSDLTVGGEKWTFDPSDISIKPAGVAVPRFVAHNGEQRMEIEGGLSRKHEDTLVLALNRIALEAVRSLAPDLPDIQGILTGDIRMVSPFGKDQLDLHAHLRAQETSVSGYDAGTLSLSGEWDNEHNRMEFLFEDRVREATTLRAHGTYQPSSHELRAKARMDSLQIGYASGFVQEVFSRLEGKISGDLAVSGPVDRLSLSSRGARLDDALLQIAFTQVPYFVSGPFHIDDYGITFDDMALKDRYDGSGTVTGGVTFDHLKDIRMATSIRVNGVEAFNTEDDGESPVYGHVGASGTVDLTGPFSSLLMSINARTQGGGDFHIPLRSGATLTGTDLLTFKQPAGDEWVDPYEQMMQSLVKKEKEKGRFAMKMRVTVDPEVQCDLEIDKDSGNILSGRGNGTISLEVGGEKAFSINGDYNLTAGDFHLNVMNIASKNFTIDSGSSIKFNGDIMDSDLDIDARYMTKTSLSNLLTDSSATSYRRNVECALKVSDKLRNPQLAFSIDIPDLDPSTKSQVESALNTEDKVQKQFVALLVTNSFLPSDQSGIFNNNTGILMSNMMEVMSGQLSNILQRLQIPLDLGLKYAAGEGGSDLFDVAVSTKLFNDRVSVNGVIGNRQYSTDAGDRDVVGDLDVEIKLDNAGNVRLNLFSHSADKYSNYLDYSQRNGVGIGYQREFNTLRSFFRSLFTSRKKRQELLFQPRPEERRKTLKILADER